MLVVVGEQFGDHSLGSFAIVAELRRQVHALEEELRSASIASRVSGLHRDGRPCRGSHPPRRRRASRSAASGSGRAWCRPRPGRRPGDHARPNRVVEVVVQVGDPVGEPHAHRLERRRCRLRPGVVHDPVADLPGEVQPAAAVLEHLDDAEGLLGVLEPAAERLRQDTLADVAERRVAEVVAERDRLGQVLVQPERASERPGDLSDLERVRETHPVVVADRREEDLRLVLEPSERLAVNDAVTVALEVGAERDRAPRAAPAPSSRRRASRAPGGSAARCPPSLR